MACGKCITTCSTGTIVEKQKGYRILLGGKLGRHPQLARELPGIYSENTVLEIVASCISFYKQHSIKGERFAEIFKPSDFDALVNRLENHHP
jgi:dissimilatory sulfite reductase (desulfoviridin) alpha/beta subunit